MADDVKALQSNATLPKFSEHDQADICEALGGVSHTHLAFPVVFKHNLVHTLQFAKIDQDFFKALANKKVFLDATTLVEPIGALLILLRAGLDHLAVGVIALVPTCAAKARDELKDLDKTLGETISTFTVHAPPVPTVQPPIPTVQPPVATNEPLNATNHPTPAPLPVPLPAPLPVAPLPGVVGGKPTEISSTGPIGTPVAAPIGRQ